MNKKLRKKESLMIINILERALASLDVAIDEQSFNTVEFVYDDLLMLLEYFNGKEDINNF